MEAQEMVNKLNELVAKARGWEYVADGVPHWIIQRGPMGNAIYADSDLPDWQNSIPDAMGLLEDLRQDGWLWKCQEMPDGIPWMANAEDEPDMPVKGKTLVTLSYIKGRTGNADEIRKFIHGRITVLENSIPTAITIAYLRARGVGEKAIEAFR